MGKTNKGGSVLKAKIIIFCTLWVLSGWYDCYYEWTKKFDVTIKDAVALVPISGILGPIMWLIIAGSHIPDTVLFKKVG